MFNYDAFKVRALRGPEALNSVAGGGPGQNSTAASHPNYGQPFQRIVSIAWPIGRFIQLSAL